MVQDFTDVTLDTHPAATTILGLEQDLQNGMSYLTVFVTKVNGKET